MVHDTVRTCRQTAVGDNIQQDWMVVRRCLASRSSDRTRSSCRGWGGEEEAETSEDAKGIK